MQNRESAVRSRQKKKESGEYLKSENEILKKENYRLYHENSYYRKEKNFLIDQIKFMQNLIKSHGMLIVPKGCAIDKDDIEKNKCVDNISKNLNPNQIVLNGERQKPLMKLFSVFLICVLSVFYISFNDSDIESNERIVFNGGSTITLNDDSDKISSSISYRKSYLKVFSLNVIIKVIIVMLMSVFVLNISQIWKWIKYKFEEKRKKLNKNL